MLQEHSLKSLQLYKILQQIYNYCDTSLANKFVSTLKPFDINRCKDSIQATCEYIKILQHHPETSYHPLNDITLFHRKLEQIRVLEPTEIRIFGTQLKLANHITAIISTIEEDTPLISTLSSKIKLIPKLTETILNSIHEDGSISDSASPELTKIRRDIIRLRQKAVQSIEKYLSGKHQPYLSENYFTQRNGRLTLPLKSDFKGKIRGYILDTSSTGHTIFIEPEDVHDITNNLIQKECEEKQEILRILTELTAEIKNNYHHFVNNQNVLIELASIQAKAKYSINIDGTQPYFKDYPCIKVLHGRHPLIPNNKVVPIDINLGIENNTLIISGPNTGGKSVSLKILGLFTIMAYNGILPPAEYFEIGPISGVFADIGDDQNIEYELSTFSAHMKFIAETLKSAEEGSLIIIDELGSGTDPNEGSALAEQIVLEFQKKNVLLAISTHHSSLKLMAFKYPNIKNAAMEFHAKTLEPTYRLIMGKTGSSNAFHVADKFGLPKALIASAKQYLGEGNLALTEALSKLHAAESIARKAQSDSDKLSHKLKNLEKELEERLELSRNAEKNVKKNLRAEFEENLREIRIELSDLFEEIKRASTTRDIDAARERSKKFLQKISTQKENQFPEESHSTTSKSLLKEGDTVHATKYNQKGTVLKLFEQDALVSIGIMKTKIPYKDLEVVKTNTPKHTIRTNKHRQLSKASMESKMSINVIGMLAEDALEKVESFIDAQMLSNLTSVKIIHGKGGGILRNVIREYLKNHPGIKNFSNGEEQDGGHGSTIAYFKI